MSHFGNLTVCNVADLFEYKELLVTKLYSDIIETNPEAKLTTYRGEALIPKSKYLELYNSLYQYARVQTLTDTAYIDPIHIGTIDNATAFELYGKIEYDDISEYSSEYICTKSLYPLPTDEKLIEIHFKFGTIDIDNLHPSLKELYELCKNYEFIEKRAVTYKNMSYDPYLNVFKASKKEIRTSDSISDIPLELLYNDEELELIKHVESNYITNSPTIDRKYGIILLHGIPGAGKSSLLERWLRLKNEDRTFILTEPSILNQGGPSEFDAFIERQEDDILTFLVEDGKNLFLKDANAKFYSTLLNYSSGIKGNAVKPVFILTSNLELSEIHPEYLRNGRCLKKIEFKPLTVEKANALLAHLGYTGAPVEVPTSLADVFELYNQFLES